MSGGEVNSWQPTTSNATLLAGYAFRLPAAAEYEPAIAPSRRWQIRPFITKEIWCGPILSLHVYFANMSLF